MENQHTPGPWMATDATWVRMDGRVGVRVIGIGRFPDVSTDEMQANALLIAAAPDLLAALENLVASADRLEIDFREDGPAMSAIAKARGLTESPK